MVLGASFNIFDGEELLPYAIKSIRKEAAHIVVVYQKTSNFGRYCSSNLMPVIEKLKADGLVDELVEYVPITNGGHMNELSKRNIGLNRCVAAGCTHHMSMDCDEFYLPDQLAYAKYAMDLDDTCACQMVTYYKYPTMALNPPETYYVPLMYRIDDRSYKLSAPWPVAADPTRKMTPKKIRLFKREEIEMHHMSYVRHDLMSKLANSSASVNFANRASQIYGHWKSWQPGQKALLAGKEERWYDLKEVPNLFGIMDI